MPEHKSDLSDEFKHQSSQYNYPYHYIPWFDEKNAGVRYKLLGWGLEYLCYQEHIKRIVEYLAPQSIIDVGCGDGRFLGSLGDVTKRIGIDMEPRAIALAKALNSDIDFMCVDIKKITELSDVAVAIEVLEHVPDEQVQEFIASLFSVVKKGGYIVISVPSVVLPLNKKHYRHYTEDLLRLHLNSAGIAHKTISMQRIYREPFWLKFYLKLTINKYWICEPVLFRRFIWKAIWTFCRYANEVDGYHIVAVLRKT